MQAIMDNKKNCHHLLQMEVVQHRSGPSQEKMKS
jgi:hypothetical protein